MFALDAVSRAALAAMAFAAFGAAFVTTPMTARGDAGVFTGPLPSVTALSHGTALTEVIPRRDPFAGGEAPAVRSSAVPPIPQIPAALRPLPPNAGASGTGFPFSPVAGSTAAVTAVITGTHPFALIDDGGTTRMLTVGDRVAGEAIVAIDADGVRLSGGTALAAPHVRPTPGGHQP
ncbi:MAG: hypothetical protein QOF71_613 [Candidatus Eremiobacteraeota bacterium]|jgi:hypothetical protein|nr:hypothetical protein [Candidatus Eremiobacteraeota bacterium]